jgi:hypothetical protein
MAAASSTATFANNTWPYNANDPNDITLRGYRPYSMTYSQYQCKPQASLWWMGTRNPICNENRQPDNLMGSNGKCQSFYYDFTSKSSLSSC